MQKLEPGNGVGRTEVPGVGGLESEENIEAARVEEVRKELVRDSWANGLDSFGSSDSIEAGNGKGGDEGVDVGKGCGRVWR